MQIVAYPDFSGCQHKITNGYMWHYVPVKNLKIVSMTKTLTLPILPY